MLNRLSYKTRYAYAAIALKFPGPIAWWLLKPLSNTIKEKK